MKRQAKDLRQNWWHALIIVLAGVIAYANNLSGPFIFDDRGTVLDNRQIEDLSDIRAVLSPPQETPVAGRPFVNLTFALNYALGGHDATGYHVVNIAQHSLCGVLVWLLASALWRRTDADPVGPLAIAVLWTLHPLNSEVVDYLSQRTESVMAFCYLTTLYAAVRSAGTPSRRTWNWIAIAACALGMTAKESMVTAPLAVLLIDRVFLFGSWSDLFAARRRLYAGLAASWLLLVALVWSSPRAYSAGFSAHDATLWTYLLNQCVLIARMYFRLALWPSSLVLYYGYPAPLTIVDVWPYAAALTALAALTVILLIRRPPIGAFGAWVFLTLAPTSSFIPIATEVGAERRMYLPLLAIVAGAVVLFWRLGWPRVWRLTVIGGVAAALTACTWIRNREYASSLTLAQTSVARWPSPGAHSMFGTELAAAGRFGEAEAELRVAADAHPPARYYLGALLASQGRNDEAVFFLQSYVRDQPAELTQVYEARRQLAGIFAGMQRLADAIDQYQRILVAHPEDGETRVSLATTLLRADRAADAVPLFQQSIAAQPSDVRALNGLGVALATLGQLDEALAAFQRVLALDAGNVNAQQNIARIRTLRGR